LPSDESGGRLYQIVHAWAAAPGLIYQQEGFAFAILFIVLSPIIVPVAALFYFSIPEDKRELLDESEEFVQ